MEDMVARLGWTTENVNDSKGHQKKYVLFHCRVKS